MAGTFAVKPDDRCRHTWTTEGLDPTPHRCGRLEGHPDTHVCSCGALVPRETETGAAHG